MKTNKDFRMSKEHKTMLALMTTPEKRAERKKLFIDAQLSQTKAKQAKFKENHNKGDEA